MSDFYSSAGIEGLVQSLKASLRTSVILFFEDGENEGHKWIQGTQPVNCRDLGAVLSSQVVLLNSVSVSHPVFLALSAQVREAGITLGPLLTRLRE